MERMNMIFLGVDNGSTGSIGVISSGGYSTMIQTPIKEEYSYTKKAQKVKRINVIELQAFLQAQIDQFVDDLSCVHIDIERPLVNPKMFKASMSAMRAYEASINVFEMMGLGYSTVDSKEWQKALLPQGIKGTPELKKASAQVATRLYPHLAEIIAKQKDGDGILIAHHLMLKYNQQPK